MRGWWASLGELFGLGVVAAGAGMVYAPAGVIVAGVVVFAAAYMSDGDV